MAKEIKKTMEAPLAWLEGKLDAEQLVEFTELFGYKADGSTSTGPREITILKDSEGEMLGRKCTVCGVFFPADRFAKNTTCIKEADGAKGKLYNESKKMEKEAMVILEEAREITDVAEKVAKFEEYDQKLLEAKEYRLQPIEVNPEWLEGSFETIEELASSLGVEVQEA